MDKCYGIIYQQYECNNPNCESVKEKHAKTPAKLAQLTAMDESGDLKKICMSEENPTKLRGLGVSFASIDPSRRRCRRRTRARRPSRASAGDSALARGRRQSRGNLFFTDTLHCLG